MVRRLAVLIVLLLSGALFAQEIRFQPVPEAKVWSRLEQFSGTNADRAQRLKSWFAEVGCDKEQVSESPVPHSATSNVLCTVPGETDRVIIVGAHTDYVNAGSGVADNWSGSALLPSLLQVVLAKPRKHTFVFIGFTQEEAGLVGSEAYLKQLQKERWKLIDAMVNLDTVGLAPPEIWATHADKSLIGVMSLVSKAMGIPVTAVNFERVGSADSDTFFKRKIPAITIHSVTQRNLTVLHSPKDRLNAIVRKDYLDTYVLSSGYLIFLDQVLPLKDKAGEAGK